MSMSNYDKFPGALPSAGLALCGAVGIALIGWLVGPRKDQNNHQNHGHGEGRSFSPEGGDGYDDDDYVDDNNEGLPSHTHRHLQKPYQSGGTNAMERREAEAEEKLQRMMAELAQLMTNNNLEASEKLVEQILVFAEETWGKMHMNYALLLGIPVANIYELKGDIKRQEEALRRACELLEPHGSEYVLDTGIVDKLINIYSGRQEHRKAMYYSLKNLKGRREALQANPNDPKQLEIFCSSAAKGAMVMANAGSFKQAEAHYKEAMKYIVNFDPASNAAYSTLEYWTNTLHQQGKTREAIVKLEEYKKKMRTIPPQSSQHQLSINSIIQKILHRAAVLLFTIDDFQETLKYLKELENFSKENKLNISLQILCDLATVYWELHSDDEAQEVQSLISNTPFNSMAASPTLPLTRSQYLCTIECTMNDGMYQLTMRVNRERPQRKEGEALEDTDQIKRKIEKCFLEITFEPTQKDAEPVTKSQMVDKPHQFVVLSPKMKPPPDPCKFYEVSMDIYNDETKQLFLGSHHQLVFCLPPLLPNNNNNNPNPTYFRLNK